MNIGILSSCLIALSLASAARGACLLDDYSVSAEYSRSFAVVTTTVLSKRTVPDKMEHEFIAGTIYTIQIQESFRGALTNRIEVFSENTSGRFPMEIGKSYILFLYKTRDHLSADNCGNSGLISQKKELLKTVRALAKASARD